MNKNEKIANLLSELAETLGFALVANTENDVLAVTPKEEYKVGGTERLKNEYGEGNTRSIVNRAIRAEIPGGNQVLDARTIAHRNRESTDMKSIAKLLDEAVFEMETK